ncbi:2TM domain-containing protein [Flavobacterium branchiicola]|uniref:2TM domain-containing protein n=1 Tax=Flavobacterium branchiicola TaxID=1114875 RepID=A0ABV9PFB3_9FLAO|nr:2TM domain-containing protein [Flavobacterium branchiicola]MBS7254483.1 2TM domain-containing protein [Flavobacterium branchiicola]
METNCNNDREEFEFQQTLGKRVVKLKFFYKHVFIYSIGLIVFILKRYYGVPLNFFPFNYLNSVVMIIWTSVFLFSAIDLLLSYTIFGEEWEERKLKSLLSKKTKKQKWE